MWGVLASDLLVHPPDRILPPERNTGVVYYITRTLGKDTEHVRGGWGVKVIDEELVDIQRKRKEAVHTRQQRPSLNRERCYDVSPHI